MSEHEGPGLQVVTGCQESGRVMDQAARVNVGCLMHISATAKTRLPPQEQRGGVCEGDE